MLANDEIEALTFLSHIFLAYSWGETFLIQGMEISMQYLKKKIFIFHFRSVYLVVNLIDLKFYAIQFCSFFLFLLFH